MTNLRNLVALGATMAIAVVGVHSFAQDDLDDLLADLESESAAAPAEASADEDAAEAEEPAAEEPAAEEPAAEEPAAEEEPTEAEEPAAEEAAAEEEPAEEESAAEEPEAEEPAAEEPAEAEEPAAEEPEAEEPAAEEPAEAEEPAVEEEPAEAEEPAAAEAATEEEPAEAADANLLSLLAETDAGVAASPAAPAAEKPAEPAAEPAETPAAVAAVEPAPAPAAEPAPAPAAEPAPAAAPVPAPAPKYDGPDAELLANLSATEKLRREAFDIQARREISEARTYMANEEYLDSVKHYRIALKLLNDAPSSEGLRRECQQGVAEGYFRAAFQEESIGRRAKAIDLMDKALAARHPKARRQLEAWKNADDPEANKVDLSEIKHRRNDAEYKDQRATNLQHLKRARQFLGSKELSRALDECELVLVNDPYNQEAIRLREKIQKKRHTILMQERKAAREGMIADVDQAWRPVYAVDARELDEVATQTGKTPGVNGDPERSLEQSVIKRMKEMRLPAISFKPPATIVDALDFFRQASKDFDRPDIPLEQRGFDIVFLPPETLHAAADSGEDEAEGFGASDDNEAAGAQEGLPVIPMIAASDITFYDALKLVCDTVKYKPQVKGKIVMVMPQGATTEEMVTRSYPVLSTFMERMDSASSELKEMRSQGFGSSNRRANDDAGENQEKDWKEFFTELGVKWPEGSSIMYIKTIGKLRVKNTYENLAELEKALTEMNADPKLIEIETRFVEVCQDDLNSLGFEWILNSDYSIGLGKHVSRALGVRNGTWGSNTGSRTVTQELNYTTDTLNGSTIPTMRSVTTDSTSATRVTYANSRGASWIRNGDGHGKVGLSAFGGDSDQQNGMRYLSTLSNHISGESGSNNDQFMRVNAFFGNADLSMILHMLAQRSDTDLLSAPKVLTRPGVEAVMKVVTEYIYPTDYQVQLQSSSSSSSGNGGGSQSAILAVVEPRSFTMREVGVILDVTPTLTDDGNLIDLDLKTQVVDEPTWKNYGMRIPFTGNASSLQNFTGLGEIFTGLSEILGATGTALSDSAKALFAQSAMDAASNALDSLTDSSNENLTYYEAPMEQPFFHVRSIESQVSVYPGATIVMGGLITEQRKAMDDKIPFLGDLPFIGRLFRSHAEQTNKRNLLIFVTTRLVDVRGREVHISANDTPAPEVVAAPTEED